MRLTVSMKCPDALDYAIKNAVDAYSTQQEDFGEDADCEPLHDQLKQQCGRWFKWGEVLTVEIDTEAQTCRVLETN